MYEPYTNKQLGEIRIKIFDVRSGAYRKAEELINKFLDESVDMMLEKGLTSLIRKITMPKESVNVNFSIAIANCVKRFAGHFSIDCTVEFGAIEFTIEVEA